VTANGDPFAGLQIPQGPPGPPLDGDPARLDALETQVSALTTRLQLLAGIVAGLVAERIQPQVQQAILAHLSGQTPTPPP
jgi:hypothetical protein